jgi:hypothetical protein
MNENRVAVPSPAPPLTPHLRQTARPMPKPRVNFIPRQSYLQYNHVDKDPDLEFALTAIAESGLTLEQIEEMTERAGMKVSRYCLLGWHYKGVRHPRNSTISMVMAVCGWDRPWTRRGN